MTLKSISIQNVGGIARCCIDFGVGFTVITGESGAGKSSVVRAIELASGKRANSSLIRAGEDEAGVEAVFDGSDSGGRHVVRRVVSRKGRGMSFLQGESVPVSVYSQAVSRLVHIQSQFAQMELLDNDRQREMVDSCGGEPLARELAELREVFDLAKAKDAELKKLAARREDVEQKFAATDEILSGMRKLDLRSGMESDLEREIDALERDISTAAKASEGLSRMTGGMSGRGLLSELEVVCGQLLSCISEEDDSADAAEAKRLVMEGLQDIGDFMDIVNGKIGRSPSAMQEDLESLEQQLGLSRKLRRMAGVKNEEELLEWRLAAEDGLAWLSDSYSRLDDLAKETKELRRKASATALSVRDMRRNAAKNLTVRVCALFEDLAMDGIGFRVAFTDLPKLRREGADGVDFELFTDKRSGRVDKIASGGELSRLLLALQLSLPDEWLPPTIIFDEVEAGLGGRAAVLSGMKLLELSRKCQVVLVTHEASIAALGDCHYVVRKHEGESRVLKIEGADRVRELARMLSGNPDLAEAQEHARRLLTHPQTPQNI
ncbi:DNA repair protein RecN [Synergistales bacterium]|nr:DNA repair protein RecN [Synergistales bacterium]